MTTTRTFIIILTLTGGLLLPACNKGPSPIKGDKLNDFFPKSSGNHKVIVTTEKKGFAQASLLAGEEEVATLAISDLVKDAKARAKYAGIEEKISGYPSISRGSEGTAILVGRFQVQVRSKIEEFAPADREKWLGNFDLDGLAGIK